MARAGASTADALMEAVTEMSALTYNDSDGGLHSLHIDYSSLDYLGTIHDPPLWEKVVKTICYIPPILLALLGNLLIIVVVFRNKRMQTTTNFYIVNLAVADMMVAAVCSWVHLVHNLTDGWVLGHVFCKLNSFMQVLTLVASIFTLTLIACDRFFGIVFAMKAHIIERRASYAIAIVWLLSAAVATPMLFNRKVHRVQWRNYVEQWCDDDWPYFEVAEGNVTTTSVPGRRAYYTAVAVVMFFLPCVLMAVVYVMIIVTLYTAQAPGERTSKDIKTQSKLKKKVVTMLILILALFIICWFPFVFLLLYNEYRPNRHRVHGDWYNPFDYFARYLAHFNSALNPIVYSGFNDNFRTAFQNLCRKKKKPSSYNTMVSRTDSFQQTYTHVTSV